MSDENFNNIVIFVECSPNVLTNYCFILQVTKHRPPIMCRFGAVLVVLVAFLASVKTVTIHDVAFEEWELFKVCDMCAELSTLSLNFVKQNLKNSVTNAILFVLIRYIHLKSYVTNVTNPKVRSKLHHCTCPGPIHTRSLGFRDVI